MGRLALLSLSLVLLGLSTGCRICASPYDYCGPVVDECCDSAGYNPMPPYHGGHGDAAYGGDYEDGPYDGQTIYDDGGYVEHHGNSVMQPKRMPNRQMQPPPPPRQMPQMQPGPAARRGTPTPAARRAPTPAQPPMQRSAYRPRFIQ